MDHWLHYHNADGVEMVKARLHPDKLAEMIQGNAGRRNEFFLDGYNEAHGTGGTGVVGQQGNAYQVGLRRFYFFLPSLWKLSRFIGHVLCGDEGLVEEFFTEGSRFHAVRETFAPHKSVMNSDNTEAYDEDMYKIKPRKAPLTPGEELDEYGCHCGGLSQEY
jgi:hypothetical protein